MGVKQPTNIAIRVSLFLIGAGLLGWSAWLLFSRLTSVVAVTAIVNGRILTISALTNGQVQLKTNLTSGMAVGAEQALLGVNPVGLNTWMQGIKLDLATEMAKLDAIASQIATNRNTAELESSATITQLTVLLNPLVQKVRQTESAVAVTPPDLRDRQVAQVRIDLDQPQNLVEGELNQARFCNVGQLVKVTINQQTAATDATERI